MFGVRRFHAVINPPQAAILAVGEVALRPVVDEDGAIVARTTGWTSRCRATTASSTAPRPPASCRRLTTLLERPVALVAA